MAALTGVLETSGPQDRRILAQRLGMTDRRMRFAVEDARLRGHLVIHDGGTYAIARTRAEFDGWLRVHRARFVTQLRQYRAMRRTASRLWPLQLHMPIFGEEVTA